jgi:MarR family
MPTARLAETLAERDSDREVDRDEAIGGCSPGEIGKELGISRYSVSSLVDELAEELSS